MTTNNHAVIVSSSKYWFNYRHVVNALSFYQLCKANGIPDENIVLMLADNIPTNARNPHKNAMYAMGVDPKKSLYDESIEIDYRGEDVTVENLVRVLLGRQGESPIASLQPGSAGKRAQKRRHLQTDENSNILIYLTGHGGDQFFKFQDIEEITSEEIARVLSEMHRRKRYKEILLVADTCQAFTLGDHITAPNVLVVGSSLRGESSYAHHSDYNVGLSVIERYTHEFTQFVQRQGGISGRAGNMTIQQAMVDPFPYRQQRAHVGFRHDLLQRDVNQTRLSDFFSNNQVQADDAILLAKKRSGGAADSSSIPSWPLENLPAISIRSSPSMLFDPPDQCLFSQSHGGIKLQSPLPIYNPSDPMFVALVALLIATVLLLSSPSIKR